MGSLVMAFFPELGLGVQIPVSVWAVFVDKGVEGFVGPGLFDDILPEGLEVLKGSFERGKGRDSVHKRAKIEPVNAFGSE